MSEVLLDEKRGFVKNKKALIADVKGHKGYIYADVDFHDTDMYLPHLWGNIRFSSIIQFNIFHIANKTAIYLSKIAVLFLTKTVFFRLLSRQKHLSFFVQFAKIKFFRNFSFKVCQILKNPCSIVLKEILYKFHLCKLNMEGGETMSSSPTVFEIAIRYFMSFWLDIKYAEIADKPSLFAFLRYSSGCRSPPPFLILRFSKIRNGGIRNARRKQIHLTG